MTFADGKDVDEGEWLAGQMHGRGRRVFRDGTIYDGAWRAGVQHGRGLTFLGLVGCSYFYVVLWTQQAVLSSKGVLIVY